MAGQSLMLLKVLTMARRSILGLARVVKLELAMVVVLSLALEAQLSPAEAASWGSPSVPLLLELARYQSVQELKMAPMLGLVLVTA